MAYYKNIDRMQDDNLVLHDATADITADALATVGGSAAAGIIDIGAVPVAFDVIIPISTLEVASNDELYEVHIVGSTSSDFSAGVVNLATLRLGAHEVVGAQVTGGDQLADSAAGTYVLSARNTLVGTTYRYVRLCWEVTGTIDTTGITPAGDVFIANMRAC